MARDGRIAVTPFDVQSGVHTAYVEVMGKMIVITAMLTGLVVLTGCETLGIKLNGGSRSGIDWAVGVRF